MTITGDGASFVERHDIERIVQEPPRSRTAPTKTNLVRAIIVRHVLSTLKSH